MVLSIIIMFTKESKKYNYVYKITNLINNKIYIGVHKTNNLNDEYMGSGTIIKAAIKKHGLEKFKKEILFMFDTYQEALDKEREIVTETFIENPLTYNIREGGFGACKYSKEYLHVLSAAAKKRWENVEYREHMQKACFQNEERNKKISNRVQKWKKENPDKHKERMEKINKNPEKIKKMADTHRGMKRTEESKINIKKGIHEALKDPELRKRRSGSGQIYAYNLKTKECKRFSDENKIPDGWKRGMPERFKTKK